MAATASVRIEKSFTRLGATKTFNNRYHFVGGVPADDSHWHTFMDAITTAEKAIYGPNVTIISATGYLAGSDLPVSSKTYSLAGTLSATSTVKAPAFSCILARWSTDVRTSKNHPVYLFNYWHGVLLDNGSDGDFYKGAQATAAQAYATAWVTGFSDGVNTLHRAGPNGAVAQSATVVGGVYDHDLS